MACQTRKPQDPNRWGKTDPTIPDGATTKLVIKDASELTDKELPRRRVVGGMTYDTRNKTYEMDADMFSILREAAFESPEKQMAAFNEGISAGRIVEVSDEATDTKA